MTELEKQNLELKNMFHDTYAELYMNLIKFINKLPLNPRMKDYAFMNFDQGSFWIREAMQAMQVITKPVEIAPTQEPIAPTEPCEKDCGHVITDELVVDAA